MKTIPLWATLACAVFAPAAEPPVVAASAEAAAKPVRRVSPETAARLAATQPKFTPPPPAEAAAKAPVERNEPDRPRNQIIRLPEYEVAAPRIPDLRERHIYTPQAKIELVFKRNPGLRIGNVFGLNGGVAAAMLADEERLERMREFQALVSLLKFSERPPSPELKGTLNQTFMHPAKFGR